MKTIVMGLVLILSVSLFAGVDPEVFVRGKISGTFNEREVSVVDSYGQKYSLPRSVFPKDFDIKQGASFAINVPDKVIQKVKIKK